MWTTSSPPRVSLVRSRSTRRREIRSVGAGGTNRYQARAWHRGGLSGQLGLDVERDDRVRAQEAARDERPLGRFGGKGAGDLGAALLRLVDGRERAGVDTLAARQPHEDLDPLAGR